MKLNATLTRLIEELKDENVESRLTVAEDATLILDVSDTGERYELNGEQAKLVLSSEESVERLFEAIDFPDEVYVEYKGIVIESWLLEILENYAATVDEI